MIIKTTNYKILIKSLDFLINTFTIVLTITVLSAIAQNKIILLRYDDDFSQLKKDSNKKGLDHLKCIATGKNNFISFGGELR